METTRDFTTAIENRLRGVAYFSVGPCPGCETCGLPDIEDCDSEAYQEASEPSFGVTPCDSCGSGLAGDRHPAHGIIMGDPGTTIMDDEVQHFKVCTDCVMFHANGELPDHLEEG